MSEKAEIIKKGEINCFKKFYENYNTNSGLPSIYNELNQFIKNPRYFHRAIALINRNKDFLQDGYLYYFRNSYFEDISINNITKKINYLNKKYKRLNEIFNNNSPKKLLIEEEIIESNINNVFINRLFGSNNYDGIIFKKKVSIKTLSSKLNLKNIIFEDNFQISIIQNKISINILHSKFLNIFQIPCLKGGNLNIGEKSNFKDIEIAGNKKEESGNITILDSVLYGSTIFEKIKANEIKISNCSIHKALELNNCDVGKIKIHDINIDFKLPKGRIELNKIKNAKEVTIGGLEKNTKIEIIKFSKVFNTEGGGLILLYNILAKDFIYHSSTIIPKLSISGVEFEQIEFSEIDLGKTMFNDITIKNGLYINGANLNDCIFNDIDFNGNYEILDKQIREGNQDKQLSKRKLKDNYRQLKYVMDKNGNNTEANKFFAKEMLYYSKTLGTEKSNIFTLLNSDFYGTDSERIGERFSLVISEIISDYGNNLLRVIFTGGMYLFVVYGILLSTNLIQDIIHMLNLFIIFNYSDVISDILILFLFIYIGIRKSDFLEKQLQKLEAKKNFERNFIFLMCSFFIGISFINIGDFEGINSFIFLLNPLSGLDSEIIKNLVWTEKIGILIHKIIFATFIYHFIVTLRRTTRR